MPRPPWTVDEQLEASLRRIADALQHNRAQYASIVEQVVAAGSAEVASRITEKSARVAERLAEKQQRRQDRRLRRQEMRRRRAEREAGAEIPRGIVFLVVAAVCLAIAFRQPGLFWMAFVALGFGMSAVSSFARAAARRAQAGEARQPQGEREEAEVEEAEEVEKPVAVERPVPAEPPPLPVVAPAEPSDPKVQRIQALCDRILAELESGPPIVREVVTEPGATIGGLRQACMETARRERELRRVLAAQDESALGAEREALAARVASEGDAIVRDRLAQALRALEQQLANRAELATAATRLEAENTRVLYTLENLHMQLLRARSTDIGAPELGGKLRESLRDLGTQIDAVAEALEWASAPAAGNPPAVPVPAADASPSSSAPTAAPADDQAAERREAARRARAQQAQRQ